MGNTQYGRTELLRLTPYEKHALNLCVMHELAAITARVDDDAGRERQQYVSTLRSLLERLCD